MSVVRVLLVGADGHMGREVIRLAAQQDDIRVVAGLSKFESESSSVPLYRQMTDVVEDFDIVIDFSNPVLLDEIVRGCTELKKPVVIATTGYSDVEEDTIRDLSAVVPVFKSANMSVGVNLLAHLAQIAAKALYPHFDIDIVEAHHRRKKDAPSGTALLLADAIRESLEDQADMKFVYDRSDRNEARPLNEIGVSAIRGGNIVGEHDIYFAGNGEVITLKHSAISREVFADGALAAARFLVKQEPGYYNMQDLF